MLSGHHVRTESVDVDKQTADLTVRVEATQLQPGPRPMAEVELVAPSGKITSVTVPLASEGGIAEVLSGSSSVRVEGAELWWTHDLGGQPRYQVTIRLRDGEQLLDEGTIWWACAPSPWIAAVIRKVDGTLASSSMGSRSLPGARLGCPPTCSSDQ